MKITNENIFFKYNLFLILLFTTFSISIITLVFILDACKLLVAPPFTNSLSLVERLRFFREVKPKKSEILAVGSSMTLNSIDSSALKYRNGQQIPYTNFSSWGVQVGDVSTWINTYLKIAEKPKFVMIISSPVDFKYCDENRKTPDVIGRRDDINDYIAASGLAFKSVYYHLKYRDLLKAINPLWIKKIHQARNTNNYYDSLKFDSSGSVVLEIPQDKINPQRWRGEVDFLKIENLSEKCYFSLESLADSLKQKQINLVLVLSPIRKDYLDSHTSQKTALNEYRQRVTAIIKKFDGIVIDAYQDMPLTDEFFVDPLHLNKNGARLLTEHISEKLSLKDDAQP